MKRILQAIHAVDGVQGSLVIEGTGQVLASQAHAVYDAELLEKVSQAIVSTVDSVRLLHEDWETLSAAFGDGTVIIRNIKASGARRNVILGVIGDNRLNPSFAGVAMRVAAGKLKALLESPEAANLSSSSLGLAESSPALGVSRPVASASSVGTTPPPMAQSSIGGIRTSADLANSGLSWSGLSSSTKPTSDVAVADPESSAFLTAATKTLGTSVGPMAKVFVKEAVRRLCADRPFGRAQWEPLIIELRKHIQDQTEAAQFMKVMRSRL